MVQRLTKAELLARVAQLEKNLQETLTVAGRAHNRCRRLEKRVTQLEQDAACMDGTCDCCEFENPGDEGFTSKREIYAELVVSKEPITQAEWEAQINGDPDRRVSVQQYLEETTRFCFLCGNDNWGTPCSCCYNCETVNAPDCDCYLEN